MKSGAVVSWASTGKVNQDLMQQVKDQRGVPVKTVYVISASIETLQFEESIKYNVAAFESFVEATNYVEGANQWLNDQKQLLIDKCNQHLHDKGYNLLTIDSVTEDVRINLRNELLDRDKKNPFDSEFDMANLDSTEYYMSDPIPFNIDFPG